MTITIYGLADPDSGEVRYVGKAKDPEKRRDQHVSEVRNRSAANGRHFELFAWIESLLEADKEPALVRLEEVEETPDDAWRVAEDRWIARFRREHGRLTNFVGNKPTVLATKSQCVSALLTAAQFNKLARLGDAQGLPIARMARAVLIAFLESHKDK